MIFLDLPQFKTISELSEQTRLSTQLLYCLSNMTSRYYKFISIPKRKGRNREIVIPSYTLRIVQKWILKYILNKIQPSANAMAFRKGDKYGNKQNAFYHADTLYGLSLDIKDFFPSITASQVFTIFSDVGYNKFAASILTNLCTLNGKLPQGSACSPALSNLVCITLDKRLSGICKKRGIYYTRYADDMYFSCDNKILLLKAFPVIRKIIEDEGFAINDKKTHFQTPSNRKQITGITISPVQKSDVVELKAPRQLKQRIRAEIFTCMVSGDYEKRQHILGEIAYVCYIEKENVGKNTYKDRIKMYIDKSVEKIQIFPELVDAFNNNKLFKDSKDATIEELNLKSEEDLDRIQEIFHERKNFLEKHQLEDICIYKEWPKFVVESD